MVACVVELVRYVSLHLSYIFVVVSSGFDFFLVLPSNWLGSASPPMTYFMFSDFCSVVC